MIRNSANPTSTFKYMNIFPASDITREEIMNRFYEVACKINEKNKKGKTDLYTKTLHVLKNRADVIIQRSNLRKCLSKFKSKKGVSKSRKFKVSVKGLRYVIKRKKNAGRLLGLELDKLTRAKGDQKLLSKWFTENYDKFTNESISNVLGCNKSSPSRMNSRFSKDINKDIKMKDIAVKFHGSCCSKNCCVCIRNNLVKKAVLDYNTTYNEVDRNRKIVQFIKSFKANSSRTSSPCTNFLCQLFNIGKNRCYSILQSEKGSVGSEEVHHAREGVSPSTKISDQYKLTLEDWLKCRLVGDPTRMVLYIPPDCDTWKLFFEKYYNSIPEEIQNQTTFKRYCKEIMDPIVIKFFKHTKCDCRICSLFKVKMTEYGADEKKLNKKIAEAEDETVKNRFREMLQQLLTQITNEKDKYAEHMRLVDEENEFLNILMNLARNDDTMLYIMFDFKVPFVLPWKKTMSQDLFCSQKRKVFCFGLVDLSEVEMNSKLYFFDPHISPESWKSVQSILEKHIDQVVQKRRIEGKPQIKRLILRSDKCGGQNWNKYMVFFMCVLIKIYGFDSVEMHAGLPGHNKMRVDTLFGILQVMCNRRNLYTANQLSEIAGAIKHVLGYYMKEGDFVDRLDYYEKVFKKTMTTGIRSAGHVKVEKVRRGTFRDREARYDFAVYFKEKGSDEWQFKNHLFKRTIRYSNMISNYPSSFNQSVLGDYVERSLIDSLLQTCSYIEKERRGEYFEELFELIKNCDYSEQEEFQKIKEIQDIKDRLGVVDIVNDDVEGENSSNSENINIFDEDYEEQFGKCMVCEYLGCQCVSDGDGCCEACYQSGYQSACFETGEDRDSRLEIYKALVAIADIDEVEWIEFWGHELPLVEPGDPLDVFVFGDDNQEARIPEDVEQGQWFKTIFIQPV